MDRREDDMAAQAWPGFVDILSATVIMFVFFVLIIVVVLFLYTIKYTAVIELKAEQMIEETIEARDESRTDGEIEKETEKKVEQVQALEKEKQELKAELDSLKEEMQQISSGFSASAEQSVLVKEKELIVFFEDSSITLTQDVVAEVENFLANIDLDVNIRVESGDNPVAVTQSSGRSVNLARMLNVRNVPLSMGYDTTSLSIHYVEPQEIEGNYHWVRLIIE